MVDVFIDTGDLWHYDGTMRKYSEDLTKINIENEQNGMPWKEPGEKYFNYIAL